MRVLAVAILLVSGCADRTLGGGDGDGGSGSGSDASSDGVTPTSGPSTVTVTTADPSAPGTVSITASASEPDPTATASSSPPNPTSDTTTGPMPSTTTDATASASDTDGFCQDGPGQPNNAQCSDPSGCGCTSGRCFVIPILGGFCGECLGDADCAPGGCTVPNPVGGIGSRCNKGEPGAGCQSDAVCVDPEHALCAPVLQVDGIIEVATCSACKTSADCPPDAANCAPFYDILNFAGRLECVPDGFIADGGGCNLDAPDGDEACASGSCGAANVMGLLKVGICGACKSDGDCGPGQTCTDPEVDLNAGVLVPAQCV